MFILIFGNVVDGLRFVGPFDTHEEALEHGEPIAEEWTITELTAPTETEETKEEEEKNNELYCMNCNHLWSNHNQNVHGTYVCRECNCRGMIPPSPAAN